MISFRKIANTWNKVFFGSDSWDKTAALNERGNSLTPLISASDFTYLMLKTLKKYYVGKYKITGEGVETLGKDLVFIIQEYLFTWSQVCIIKLDNKWLIGNYMIEKRDLNAVPTHIKFIPLREDLRKKKGKKDKATPLKNGNKDLIFEIGKDAVIIKNGPAEFVNQNKQAYTQFFVITKYLNELGIVWDQIMNNSVITGTKIAIGGNVNDKVATAIKNAIYSGEPVLQIGLNRQGNVGNLFNAIDVKFEDRSKELIETFNFIWDKIMNELGANSNANNIKRERETPDEVNVNKEYVEIINETELNYINMGLKQLEKTFNIKLNCELNEIKKPKEPEGDDKNEKSNESD